MVAAATSGTTITFSPKMQGGQTITLASQIQLNLNNVTGIIIDGTGANVTISGGSKTSLFELTAGTCNINNLKLTQGLVKDDSGGAIKVDVGASLYLNTDQVTNNLAEQVNFVSANGGAIDNQGTLTISNSVISSNTADIYGGAIISESSDNGGTGR